MRLAVYRIVSVPPGSGLLRLGISRRWVLYPERRILLSSKVGYTGHKAGLSVPVEVYCSWS
jgi:hypothetical protein